MKKYHKIETLFDFDKNVKKFILGHWRNENVYLLKDLTWVFTEKIDGMNFRIHWDGHELKYAGRTDKTNFSSMQKEYIENELVNEDKEQLFEQEFGEKVVTVYGELFGEKIQGGELYTNNNGLSFKAFDVLIDGLFLEHENAEEVSESLGYGFVPIVYIGDIDGAINYVKKTDKSTFSDAKLEGVVGKPVGDFRDRLGNRIITKIKKKDLEKTVRFEYENEI
jgi:hypothetical protein